MFSFLFVFVWGEWEKAGREWGTNMADDHLMELRVTPPVNLDPERNENLFLAGGAVALRPLFCNNTGRLECFRCRVVMKDRSNAIDMDVLTRFDGELSGCALLQYDTLWIKKKEQRQKQRIGWTKDDELVQMLRGVWQGRELDEERLMTLQWDDGECVEFGRSDTVDSNRVLDALQHGWTMWQNKKERGWFAQHVVIDQTHNRQLHDDNVALNALQNLAYYLRTASGDFTDRSIFQLPCAVFERPAQPFLLCVGRRRAGKWVVEMEQTHTLCSHICELPDELPFCWEWVLMGMVVMTAGDRRRWKHRRDRRRDFVFEDAMQIRWMTVLLADAGMDVFQRREALELLAPRDWCLAEMRRGAQYSELVEWHRRSTNGLLVQRGWERGHLSRGTDVGTYDKINKQWINWTKPDFAKDGAKVVGAQYSRKTGQLLAWEVVWRGKKWTAKVDMMPAEYKRRDWRVEPGMTVGIVVNTDVIKPRAYALDFDETRGGYCGDNIEDYLDFVTKARSNSLIETGV